MTETSSSSRLEAFSDGVFAIAITLLVIDIKIPPNAEITNTADFWQALKHIAPSIFAFLLSFCNILITWVNHHHALRLVHKVSSKFIYANGFLLLTVAIMPFPTSLLGEYVLTDHAAPAVILYNSVMSLQALSWVLITQFVLKDKLGKNEKANHQISKNGRFGAFAFFLYALLAVLAIWVPLAAAIITTLTWIFWLIVGFRIKNE